MTYGRYREGSTLAHRLDPRTKLAFVLALVVASFAATGPIDLGVLAVVAAGTIAVSGLGVRDAFGLLRPFAWLMAFVFAFNSLYASGGLARGLESTLRFAIVLLGTSSLMVTTSPTELTDAVALLLGPVARKGVRVGDLALVVGMTLRFVPVMVEEFRRVRSAQLARRAPLGAGGPLQRVRSYVPVLVPTFASALRRSRRLALALENRGYGLSTEQGRTCIRSYRLHAADWAVLALCAALLAIAL